MADFLEYRFDLSIKVLLAREDREYCAHGLEVDLLGYGATEKAAMADLAAQIRSQMTFAAAKQKPEMLLHPAPPADFAAWEDANRAALEGLASVKAGRLIEVKAAMLLVDPAKMLRAARGAVYREAAALAEA